MQDSGPLFSSWIQEETETDTHREREREKDPWGLNMWRLYIRPAVELFVASHICRQAEVRRQFVITPS
jgi:hypothetical protein